MLTFLLGGALPGARAAYGEEQSALPAKPESRPDSATASVEKSPLPTATHQPSDSARARPPNPGPAAATKLKADSAAAKAKAGPPRLTLKGGGSYTDLNTCASFASALRVFDNLRFALSYDFVGVNNVDREYFLKQALKKRKKLLISSLEYTWMPNTVIGVIYDSDSALHFYSTLFKGGLKHQIAPGLSLDGYMGVKVGRVDRKEEKEDVVGSTLKYKMPKGYTNNIIGFDIEASYRVPRKYVSSSMFDGPWVGGVVCSLSFPVTDNVRFGGDYNIRRDYFPDLRESLLRRTLNLTFTYVASDAKQTSSK